jgi:tRNA G10  N-methylase Trm11
MPHPAKMLPALAERAVETFTKPGDLVLDPMCGIGTTLVESIHLGRDAIGIEYEPRWAVLARANVEFAREHGAPGAAEVVTGDCRYARSLVPDDALGQVAMILTSPPYGASTHGRVRTTGGQVRKWDHTYSADRANLAHQGLDGIIAAMGALFREASFVLAPDGVVVLTARPWRRDGALVDLPGRLVAVAQSAGFGLVERDVALLAAVRADGLVSRASFFQLNEVRKARERGTPLRVIAHEDVLVFERRR